MSGVDYKITSFPPPGADTPVSFFWKIFKRAKNIYDKTTKKIFSGGSKENKNCKDNCIDNPFIKHFEKQFSIKNSYDDENDLKEIQNPRYSIYK